MFASDGVSIFSDDTLIARCTSIAYAEKIAEILEKLWKQVEVEEN